MRFQLIRGRGGEENAEPVPLDMFALAYDPEGVFSEQKSLAVYADEQPATRDARKIQQVARLRDKRLGALKRLEQAMVDAPRSDHTVDGWFEPVVAMRPNAVGLTTLGRLVDANNVFGYRWYARVPCLRATGANVLRVMRAPT